MSNTSSDVPKYEHKPAFKYASTVGLQAGIVGLFVSTLQNALGTHNHGAMGVFTRTGGTIGFFAAMGATFALTEAVVANERQKKDAISGAAGACAAGFLAGVRARSLPMAFGSCAVMGAAMGMYDYAGTLTGDAKTMEERRREFARRPLNYQVESTDQ
ncbi:hypothetical protein BDQ17DRAFT_1395459 [Cyathus striatus]|nr:hypothetical protein BDQ17DRAFT_1395459 [Cyathus striatus]